MPGPPPSPGTGPVRLGAMLGAVRSMPRPARQAFDRRDHRRGIERRTRGVGGPQQVGRHGLGSILDEQRLRPAKARVRDRKRHRNGLVGDLDRRPQVGVGGTRESSQLGVGQVGGGDLRRGRVGPPGQDRPLAGDLGAQDLAGGASPRWPTSPRGVPDRTRPGLPRHGGRSRRFPGGDPRMGSRRRGPAWPSRRAPMRSPWTRSTSTPDRTSSSRARSGRPSGNISRIAASDAEASSVRPMAASSRARTDRPHTRPWPMSSPWLIVASASAHRPSSNRAQPA